MLFAVPMGRARQLLAGFAMLGSTACAGGPSILATPGVCSALLPDSWRRPVPGAPLPTGDTVGDWIAFGDAQTGQLDKANGRTADAIGIVERCEARDAAALKRARPRVLGIF
jgi:hypothetical protein